MARLIDADAFIEDIKTEAMNLYLDGMKGTPRPRSELYDIIDRIGEQPTVDAVMVVRCEDCKSGDWSGECVYCLEHGCYMDKNSFCSEGKREEAA